MVAARETTLQELLEGSKQYLVPLYQRTYSWTTRQLQRLWDDIASLAEDRVERPDLTHFIGSVVLAPTPQVGPAGVAKYLVVDGQQRLTTLTLLLAAIRDHRAGTEGPGHVERIDEQYLTNKWKPADERLKLLPTQADREAYLAVVERSPHAGGGDGVGAAYRFFRARLVASDDPDDPHDIERIEHAVISGLALVCVTTQPGDNVHRIFESLNNTGLALSQADLIRNYLFMRLPTRAEVVYSAVWLPLQHRLGRNREEEARNLELLFWLDLVMRDPRVTQGETFAAQQKRLDRMTTEPEIEAEVERFAALGHQLATILDPSREPDDEVRRRLERLNAWGTTTAYALLLHLLQERSAGRSTSEEVASAMLVLESYLVRRMLIGRATTGLNRTLLAAVSDLPHGVPVDDALRAYLSSGRKYFASDDEVRAGVRSVPFYLNGRPGQRALVLRWLEESYGSKEPVDPAGLTIEHVLPQTVTPEWLDALAPDVEDGEDVETLHASLVHTLGNLTLTGYNSELSNSAFEFKRAELARSGVRLSQEIAQQTTWGKAQILARAERLSEAVTRLWPGPSKQTVASSVRWDVIDAALAELPAGAWTTYGDLASLIGSHPVPVGVRMATVQVPNAHRVLQAGGTVSPGFRWPDPERTDDPVELLRTEGVEFDEHMRANPDQRITTAELAVLLGIEAESVATPTAAAAAAVDPERHERFARQLTERVGPDAAAEVLRFVDSWLELGGEIVFGTAATTSGFLLTGVPDAPWPMVLYPGFGRGEVPFQYMVDRPPFNDLALREEFRARLSGVAGIDLPRAKLGLRPGFPIEVLGDSERGVQVLEHLVWFRERVLEG